MTDRKCNSIDPGLFDAAAIDVETAAFNASIEKELSAIPPLYTLEPRVLRAARWLAAGNPSELAVYPGGIHAFNAFPIALAQKANNRIGEFIRHAEYQNY